MIVISVVLSVVPIVGNLAGQVLYPVFAGGLMLGCRAIDRGEPLTFGQATGRYFATFLSAIILCIGFIMAGIRTDKRALHDLLAGTRVIRL